MPETELNTVTKKAGASKDTINFWSGNNSKKETKEPLPWQANAGGMVIGFFFGGVICLLISWIITHRYDQGNDIRQFVKAYNIFLAIFILGGMIFFFFYLLFLWLNTYNFSF